MSKIHHQFLWITILFGAFFIYDFGNVFQSKGAAGGNRPLNKGNQFYGVAGAPPPSSSGSSGSSSSGLSSQQHQKQQQTELPSQSQSSSGDVGDDDFLMKTQKNVKKQSRKSRRIKRTAQIKNQSSTGSSSSSSICPVDCSCLGNYLQCEKLQLRTVPNIPDWVNNIELSHNYLTDAVDQSLQNLTNLIGLELNGNEIRKFPVFMGLTALETLQLSRNAIKVLTPEGILTLPKLKHLDLSYNQLETILPNSFPVQNQLRQLNLNNNLIRNLIGRQSFGNLKALRRLELSGNQLERIARQTFENLTSLRILKLRNNSIGELESNTFSNLRKLQILELDGNRIERITATTFLNLSALITLSLGKNQITSIDRRSWQTQLNLKYLDLSYNQLTSIQTEMFQHLPSSIIDLNLRHNQIERIESRAFSNGLTGTLDLSWNRINFDCPTNGNCLSTAAGGSPISIDDTDDVDADGDVDAENPDAGEYSFYEEMEFDDVELRPQSPFYGLIHLRNLQLESNQIDILSSGFFSQAIKLEQINLNDNPIKAIEQNPFDGLKNLIDIKLNTKLLDCDCKLLWFSNWLKERGDVKAAATAAATAFETDADAAERIPLIARGFFKNVNGFCLNPMELRQLNVRTISAEHFICRHHDQNFNHQQQQQQPNHNLFRIKPQIIEEPRSTVIGQGVTKNISCTAESPIDRPMTFLWKHENEMLNGGGLLRADTAERSVDSVAGEGNGEGKRDGDGQQMRQYEIYQQTVVAKNLNNMTVQQSILCLLNVSRQRANHHGRYQCIVSNSDGVVHSQKIKITVGSLPEFTKIPNDITLNATETARLECAAVGDPKPQIYWQKDGGNDFPAARERRLHVMQNDDVFFITNAKLSDMGLYTCTAENTVGIVRTNATLRVHERPSFVKQMQDKNIAIGMTAVLECMAAGSPKPSLVWLKDGRAIQRTERHFFAADDQLLIIVDTKLNDAGTYQCEMSNYIQTIIGYTQLNVFQPPPQQQQPPQQQPINRMLLNGYRIIDNGKKVMGGKKTGGPFKGGGDDFQDQNQNQNNDELLPVNVDDLNRTKVNAINIDEMTSIVVITVVCCAVGTSIVWVIIIYQTRKRRRRRSLTTTTTTTNPAATTINGNPRIPTIVSTMTLTGLGQIQGLGFETGGDNYCVGGGLILPMTASNDLSSVSLSSSGAGAGASASVGGGIQSMASQLKSLQQRQQQLNCDLMDELKMMSSAGSSSAASLSSSASSSAAAAVAVAATSTSVTAELQGILPRAVPLKKNKLRLIESDSGQSSSIDYEEEEDDDGDGDGDDELNSSQLLMTGDHLGAAAAAIPSSTVDIGHRQQPATTNDESNDDIQRLVNDEEDDDVDEEEDEEDENSIQTMAIVQQSPSLIPITIQIETEHLVKQIPQQYRKMQTKPRAATEMTTPAATAFDRNRMRAIPPEIPIEFAQFEQPPLRTPPIQIPLNRQPPPFIEMPTQPPPSPPLLLSHRDHITMLLNFDRQMQLNSPARNLESPTATTSTNSQESLSGEVGAAAAAAGPPPPSRRSAPPPPPIRYSLPAPTTSASASRATSSSTSSTPSPLSPVVVPPQPHHQFNPILFENRERSRNYPRHQSYRPVRQPLNDDNQTTIDDNQRQRTSPESPSPPTSTTPSIIEMRLQQERNQQQQQPPLPFGTLMQIPLENYQRWPTTMEFVGSIDNPRNYPQASSSSNNNRHHQRHQHHHRTYIYEQNRRIALAAAIENEQNFNRSVENGRPPLGSARLGTTSTANILYPFINNYHQHHHHHHHHHRRQPDQPATNADAGNDGDDDAEAPVAAASSSQPLNDLNGINRVPVIEMPGQSSMEQRRQRQTLPSVRSPSEEERPEIEITNAVLASMPNELLLENGTADEETAITAITTGTAITAGITADFSSERINLIENSIKSSSDIPKILDASIQAETSSSSVFPIVDQQQIATINELDERRQQQPDRQQQNEEHPEPQQQQRRQQSTDVDLLYF